MKKYKTVFNVCGSIVLFSVSSLATLNAREVCYVAGETCSLSYNSGGYYYDRVCKPIVSCYTVPDPVLSPTSPTPPSPTPTPPSPTPTPTLERQQCLDNAARVGNSCSEAYATAKNLCDATNALFGGGAGRGLVTLAVWKQLISKDSQQLVETITAATGALGFTAETVFPCNEWNTMAVNYCLNGVQNLKAKCPSN